MHERFKFFLTHGNLSLFALYVKARCVIWCNFAPTVRCVLDKNFKSSTLHEGALD